MSREYSLGYLADYLACQYVGDAEVLLTGVNTLEHALPTQLSFLDNPRYRSHLKRTQAAAVILSAPEVDYCSTNALVVDNPYFAYAQVARLFASQPVREIGIHQSACIDESAKVGQDCSIGPNVVIGANTQLGDRVTIYANSVIANNVTIGSDTIIYPNVSIYYDVSIGERAIIHSGVVIGADGFGFAKQEGHWHKVAQLGGVRIGHDVEIGANTSIDRGAIRDTVIADDVKLDNQIQIAHNVRIGEHTAVAGCAGIAGSSVIGRDCLIGGGVGIAGHVQITDNVALTAMSGVSKSLQKPGVYSSGISVQPNEQWNKTQARLRQLDSLARRIKQLEQALIIDEREQG